MCFRSVNDDNNTKADAGFWPLLPPPCLLASLSCGGSMCFRLRNRKALFWPSPSWNSAILLTANAQHVRHRFEERNNYNTEIIQIQLDTTHRNSSAHCAFSDLLRNSQWFCENPGSNLIKHHTWPISHQSCLNATRTAKDPGDPGVPGVPSSRRRARRRIITSWRKPLGIALDAMAGDMVEIGMGGYDRAMVTYGNPRYQGPLMIHWWSIDFWCRVLNDLRSGLLQCHEEIKLAQPCGDMWRVHLEHNSVHAEHWKTVLDKWHCGLWRRRSEDFPNVPDQLGPNMKLLTAIRKMKLQTLCAFAVDKCIQMPKFLNQRSVEVGSALISCSLTGSSAKIHAHFGIMIPSLHRLHHGFRSKTKFFQ